jgi:hypothetical protein
MFNWILLKKGTLHRSSTAGVLDAGIKATIFKILMFIEVIWKSRKEASKKIKDSTSEQQGSEQC